MAATDFAIVSEGTQLGTTAANVGMLWTGLIIPMSYSLSKKNLGDALEWREDRLERGGATWTGESSGAGRKIEDETFPLYPKK
jgi:hypothetical protein